MHRTHLVVEDFDLCQQALLVQAGETVFEAAHRAIRRSQRLGIVTRRTEMARILACSSKQADPFLQIKRAADFWRQGEKPGNTRL
jgi:hypothetical protein